MHRQPSDGPPVLLGRGCTRMSAGSVRLDREAIYCTDGNWQNVLRLDKASGDLELEVTGGAEALARILSDAIRAG
jgi:hypothetical protein